MGGCSLPDAPVLSLINSAFSWLAERLSLTMDWTSIQVNRNTVSDWHADSGNIGLSMMIVLGRFSGGEFQVGTSSPQSLAGVGICFSGAEQHRSLPFQGERWSLIAFCHRAHSQVTDQQRSSLRRVGFPVGRAAAPDRPLPEKVFLDLCAGSRTPLSFAVSTAGLACAWPHDASPRVGGHWHDLLSPETEDLLFRLCRSGRVGFAAAAPPCSDHSQLRALPAGPPAVRDADHVLGLPGLNSRQTEQLQTSHAIHTVIAELLQAVADSGGHFSWENPPSSLALLEPQVRQLFSNTQCQFVIARACSFEQDSSKVWLFATSWPPLQCLGEPCRHAHKHPGLLGRRPDGSFASAASAAYPPGLAQRFANAVSPLLSEGPGRFVNWPSLLGMPAPQQSFRVSASCQDKNVVDVSRSPPGTAFPQGWGNPFKVQDFPRSTAIQKFREALSAGRPDFKPLCGKPLRCRCPDIDICHADVLAHRALPPAAPTSSPGTRPSARFVADGGGLPSTGDWRSPPAPLRDTFKELRNSLLKILVRQNGPARLLACARSGSRDCPFPESMISEAVAACSAWLSDRGHKHDTAVPAGQPFRLGLFEGLLRAAGDADADLPAILRQGVPTGVLSPIKASGIWRPLPAGDPPPRELHECEGNWKSADSDIPLAQSLVDEDVSEGFVECFEGSLQDAHVRWPAGVAVGKLGIAYADGRSPRLIMDSTVAGVNPCCQIQEKCFNPSLADVSQTIEPGDTNPSWGFSLDVSRAHKRVLVREEERGLLLFGLAGKLYFYRTCHFGAVFSAYWWARTGAALHRLLHILLWAWHCGWLYVDDWLWRLCRQTAPLHASLIALFLCALNVPIGWHKTALGPSLTWIGFQLNWDSLSVELPAAKVLKVANFLTAILECTGSIERTTLEKGTGLLLWVTSACKVLRPWLSEFYAALASSTPLRLTLSRAQLESILPCLDASNVCFKRCPRGPVMPGMRLISVANSPPTSHAAMLASASASSKVGTSWRNPRSPRVPVTARLRELASLWRHAVLNGRWRFPLGCLPPSPGQAAADACASGSSVGIGGWFTLTDACSVPADVWWFSLRFDVCDMPSSWDMRPESQRDIASYELLAQLVLFVLRARMQPASRCRARLRASTDNTPSEGAGNKLFSTAAPLRHVLHALSAWCACFRCELELDHVQGELNVLADGLSREHDSALSAVQPSRRLAVDLAEMCGAKTPQRVFPAEAKIPDALARVLKGTPWQPAG